MCIAVGINIFEKSFSIPIFLRNHESAVSVFPRRLEILTSVHCHFWINFFQSVETCICCKTTKNHVEPTIAIKGSLGNWRDLSGSGIYQAHAAFNSRKHDLNISKLKISPCEPSWIIVLSFYLNIIPITLCFISPGSAEYL